MLSQTRRLMSMGERNITRSCICVSEPIIKILVQLLRRDRPPSRKIGQAITMCNNTKSLVNLSTFFRCHPFEATFIRCPGRISSPRNTEITISFFRTLFRCGISTETRKNQRECTIKYTAKIDWFDDNFCSSLPCCLRRTQ